MRIKAIPSRHIETLGDIRFNFISTGHTFFGTCDGTGDLPSCFNAGAGSTGFEFHARKFNASWRDFNRSTCQGEGFYTDIPNGFETIQSYPVSPSSWRTGDSIQPTPVGEGICNSDNPASFHFDFLAEQAGELCCGGQGTIMRSDGPTVFFGSWSSPLRITIDGQVFELVEVVEWTDGGATGTTVERGIWREVVNP